MVNNHAYVRCIYFIYYLRPEGLPYSTDIDAFLSLPNYSLYLANDTDNYFLSWRFNARQTGFKHYKKIDIEGISALIRLEFVSYLRERGVLCGRNG